MTCTCISPIGCEGYTAAAPRGGLAGLVPPISHRDQFPNSSKSDEKEWGGGTVGFFNVSRSNKYTCRVTKNCAFKLYYLRFLSPFGSILAIWRDLLKNHTNDLLGILS